MEIATVNNCYTSYYVKCPPQKRTIILKWCRKSKIITTGTVSFFLQFPELIFLIESDISYPYNNPLKKYLFKFLYLYGIPYLPNVGEVGHVCLGKNYPYQAEFYNQSELIHFCISTFWNIPFFVVTSNGEPLEPVFDYLNKWQNLKRCPKPHEHNLEFKPIITPNLNDLKFEPLNKTKDW